VVALARLAPLGVAALNGTCSRLPTVTLAADGKSYVGEVADLVRKRTASITHDRLLLVK